MVQMFVRKRTGVALVVMCFMLGTFVVWMDPKSVDFEINFGEKKNGNLRQVFETSIKDGKVTSSALLDKTKTGNASCQSHEPTSETYMEDRLRDVANKCNALMATNYFTNLTPTGTVWTYKPLGLYYCMTPKVGCTFWKRIMRFLSGDYKDNVNVERPSEIDRSFVHYGNIKRLGVSKMKDPEQRKAISTNRSFMFARDPYSRLWSAYIDKFLLPDFWRTDALNLIKKVRVNATLYELTCANNATFVEFIKFVVMQGSKGGFNEHWEPVSRICSPCHVAFDAIGKQESFAKDTEYILSMFKMDKLNEKESRYDRTKGETRMLVDYNLRLENAIKKGCFERLDVAEKLWKAFQFNGYIHRSINFPSEKVSAFITLKTHIANYTDLIMDTIAAQEKQGLSVKSQKREMMVEAYREVPDDYIRELQNLYKYDFELFDYDPCPRDLSPECEKDAKM